jgi:hypothetical protein
MRVRLIRRQASVARVVLAALLGHDTAYLVGKLDFERRRERAAAALGAKFDLRVFHNQVLRYGPMPLAAIEDLTNRWIHSVPTDRTVADPTPRNAPHAARRHRLRSAMGIERALVLPNRRPVRHQEERCITTSRS